MKNTDINLEKKSLEEVLGGAWGTIGPNFVKLMDTLGKPYGMKHALATFSVTAALEAVLRGLEIGYGDEVLVSDWSLPSDSSVAVAVGATPVFCDVCETAPTLCVKSLQDNVTAKTKAVIIDYSAENPCDIKSISAYCREKKIYVILNLGGYFGVNKDGKKVTEYADAAVADMSEGTAFGVGYAGAAFTNDKEMFDSFFAFHNCGRPFGEGCTLSFGGIIGGDLRIDEWQASLLVARVGNVGKLSADEADSGADEKRFVVMHRQPLIKSEYYKTYTGSMREYKDKEFPNVKKFGLA